MAGDVSTGARASTEREIGFSEVINPESTMNLLSKVEGERLVLFINNSGVT